MQLGEVIFYKDRRACPPFLARLYSGHQRIFENDGTPTGQDAQRLICWMSSDPSRIDVEGRLEKAYLRGQRGTSLGSRKFWPFWEAAQDLGVVSFMHPEGGKCAWFQQFGMWNSIAQSLEEAKFMVSIIYEGVLESFPKLKIVISHGGGYFPHNMGRLDRNVKNAPQSMKNITRKPSEYLRSVHYDTCLFDPSVLSALIKIVGSDRLVLGSDYPVGESDPVGFVSRCPDIGDVEKRMILGGKAAELIGGVN